MEPATSDTLSFTNWMDIKMSSWETVGTIEYLVDKVDRFPDYIVVAIENTDRNRDLFPERGPAITTAS